MKCSDGFATIWRKTFSSKALFKTRLRNCLQLEAYSILTISMIPSRIDKLMSSRQAEVSY
jgi:hypothetical protein